LQLHNEFFINWDLGTLELQEELLFYSIEPIALGIYSLSKGGIGVELCRCKIDICSSSKNECLWHYRFPPIWKCKPSDADISLKNLKQVRFT
jgi:hypothetical protein